MTEVRQIPHVVMLLSNKYRPDNRVQKEAHTLALAGWRVTVIAWDRQAELVPHELELMPEGLISALAGWEGRADRPPLPVSIVRVRVSAGYRSGRQMLAKMPLFWWRLWHEMRRARPDVIHANDLDTLPVAYLYGRWAGVPVVYDAREFYPGMVRDNVGPVLTGWLEALDRWLAPRVCAIVTVGDRLADHFRAMGGRVWIVRNSQPLPDRAALEIRGRAIRARLGVPEQHLLVVYVGVLTEDRLLAPLLEAVPRMDKVHLVIGGEGPQAALVQQAARECRRIHAVGWVPVDDVTAWVAAGDVVYYGLDRRNPNSHYFMPTLAFHTLAAGRPLLTTPVGEIAEMVQREGIGLVMDQANAAAAGQALAHLQEPDLYARLAGQAHECGSRHYTWACDATRLWEVYQRVMCAKCQ